MDGGSTGSATGSGFIIAPDMPSHGFSDSPVNGLDEAAMVDGYGIIQTFWYVTLPLVAPGLAVSAVFCFIFSWNEFLFALMLTGSKAQTATQSPKPRQPNAQPVSPT